MKTRIAILGGGFGGIYTAIEMERTIASNPDIEVTLINHDNFFLFTPMLHEVAASDLDVTHIVNPIRKLLRRVRFVQGDVERIDLHGKRVDVSHGRERHHHEIEYDHLIIGLGNVTNFYGLPGLAEHALTMKSLGDAIFLRGRLIQSIEEADFECMSDQRSALMTIVVAGGGFAGVETIAGVNDFIREAIRFYPNIREEDLRVVLVHAGPVILPELSEKLGRYAEGKLRMRGVDIRLNTRVLSYRNNVVQLSDGSSIPANTLVWTAGTAPHPLLETLACPKDRGRISANEYMEVPGWPGVWVIGDCASIPGPNGAPYPPTAQHALRQGRLLARNISAAIRGGQKKPFVFATLGQLAAIGKRAGVAQIFGFKFSGFIAWWLWRTIYLSKLPRFEKKCRVALDWTLDLLFSKDLVQFTTVAGAGYDRPPSRELDMVGAVPLLRGGGDAPIKQCNATLISAQRGRSDKGFDLPGRADS